MFSRPFETRYFPKSLAASLAVLPSMSLFPYAPFDLSVLPIYVTRVPAAPFTRCYHRSFTLITRTARACASYPSCVAVYPRGSRPRRVLCRSFHSLHSTSQRITWRQPALCEGGSTPHRCVAPTELYALNDSRHLPACSLSGDIRDVEAEIGMQSDSR